MSVSTVNIRPGVSVLSVLRHLNYRHWFALAEFVDNSVQSYVANESRLKPERLRVSIDIQTSSPARIVIRDNAGGINALNYERAFRPAAIPPDRSGLSEFGMGMKSAACWFSPRWTVRTSALDETTERTVRFDIEKIVNDDINELSVQERAAAAETHFTEVILEDLHRPPVGRTLGKIKDHLTDIYRMFLRDGRLELSLNGEPLTYTSPTILRAPYFRTPDATPIEWRKDIDFDFGGGMRVSGFAAIRETASVSSAGFALFRRDRLIQGSADEGYRPEYIFGKPNSYAFQRLYGELRLDGFEVAQTKDGIKWDENEQPFLELLRTHLDTDEMPLLRQANGYRARQSREAVSKVARQAVERTASTLEKTLEAAAGKILDHEPDDQPPPESLPGAAASIASHDINLKFRDEDWRISIEMHDDPAVGEWLEVADAPPVSQSGTPRILRLRLSLAHPFMVRFAGSDGSSIEPLLRLAAAVGLSEVLSREAGVRRAGTFRRNVNDILRDALSDP